MKHSLAHDTISRVELEALCEWILGDNRLTKGPETLNFETEFAQYMGSKHALFVNSGSSANLVVAYAALSSRRLRNRIAIAPAVSWVTTVTPLLQLGYEVKLCDADENDLGLSVDHFEQLCAQYRPSIAFLVHVLGHANKMTQIMEICAKYDVMLIEDSCEALSSEFDHKKLGTFGAAGTYSFYYGHHISTIEGGMVVTEDTELYHKMMSIRSHGWSRDLPDEKRRALQKKYGIDDFRNLYTFYNEGFNLRSTDLQAKIGRSQVCKLDDIALVRNKNMKSYEVNLKDYFVQVSHSSFVSNFAYGTFVSNPHEVSQTLSDNGIESRPLICGNIARHPFWIDRFGDSDNLPIANKVHDHGIYLPNHANMTSDNVKYISDVFKKIAIPFF